jgi:hypothetical protein
MATVACAIPEISDIPNSRLKVIVGGILLSSTGKMTTFSKSQRNAALRDNLGFIRETHRMLGPGKSGDGAAATRQKNFSRVGVLAAVYLTRQRRGPRAMQFWREVIEESNPAPNSGSRILATWLGAVRMGASSAKSNTSKSVTYKEMLVKSIHAFNAWAQGADKVILKYYTDAPIPEPATIRTDV